MSRTKCYLFLAALTFLISSCSSNKKVLTKTTLLNNQTFKLTEISTDSTYGLTEENPIKVGGITSSEGPLNENRFLNALADPNGEDISYKRLRSCCPFKTKNGFQGGGLLDEYELTYKGLKKPILIYINMYDHSNLKAPVGFTISE